MTAPQDTNAKHSPLTHGTLVRGQHPPRYAFAAWILILLTYSLVIPRSARAVEIPVDRLLEGVLEIASPGVPGGLCVAGPAQAVMLGKAGGTLQPVAAATTLGKGRVLALGHEGFFWKSALETADTKTFLLNAVRWVAGEGAAGDDKPRVLVVRAGDFAACLKEAGFESRVVPRNGWEGQLTAKPTSADVLVIDVGDIRTKEQGSAVWRFVREGGGLLIGSPGWGWLQLHRGQTLDEDHPGNLLLSRRGIVWTRGTISKTGERGFLVNRELLEACNANKALEILRLHDNQTQRSPEEVLRAAAHTLEEAATAFRADDRWVVPKLKTLVKDRSTTTVSMGCPEAENTRQGPFHDDGADGEEPASTRGRPGEGRRRVADSRRGKDAAGGSPPRSDGRGVPRRCPGWSETRISSRRSRHPAARLARYRPLCGAR